MKSFSPVRILHWSACLAIIIATLFVYSKDLDSYTFYHGDEGFWIETAKY